MQQTIDKNNNNLPSHLEEKDFEQFYHGNMSDDAIIHFMEHISSCTYCAQHFASYQEKDLAQTPPDFKRDILTETNRISRSVQSARQAFRRYCLQVAFSTCAALVLVFSGSHMKLNKLPKTKLLQTDFSITETVNEYLNNFSTTLSISWEELLHDKKEK